MCQKSKHKKYYTEDSRYIDGYGLDKRKNTSIDKRKEHRFARALKVKNVDELLKYSDEDDIEDDKYFIDDRKEEEE
jgi:hypothetical protein